MWILRDRANMFLTFLSLSRPRPTLAPATRLPHFQLFSSQNQSKVKKHCKFRGDRFDAVGWNFKNLSFDLYKKKLFCDFAFTRQSTLLRHIFLLCNFNLYISLFCSALLALHFSSWREPQHNNFIIFFSESSERLSGLNWISLGCPGLTCGTSIVCWAQKFHFAICHNFPLRLTHSGVLFGAHTESLKKYELNSFFFFLVLHFSLLNCTESIALGDFILRQNWIALYASQRACTHLMRSHSMQREKFKLEFHFSRPRTGHPQHLVVAPPSRLKIAIDHRSPIFIHSRQV